VVINCSDSHKKTLGLSGEIERKTITIENNVFIGTQVTILGGTFIGHHSVISAGSILKDVMIPPYSLVVGGQIKVRYYMAKIKGCKTVN
jgi:acetyltransferase-like isoleucine patch superfamily enzyme